MEQQEGSLAASPNLVSASEVTQHEVCEDTHWVPVDGSKRNHLPPVCPILLKVMATVCVHWAGVRGGGRRAEGSSGGGVGRWVTVSCSSETVQNSQGLFRDDLAPLYIQVIKQMIFNQGRAVVTDVHCWANGFNPGRCSSCCFCYSIYTDMTLNIQWNCTYADDVALFYFSFFLPSF